MMKMKKSTKFIILALAVVVAAVGIFLVIWWNSRENRLRRIGYSDEEVTAIIGLSDENQALLLDKSHQANITQFINHQDFDESKLSQYLALQGTDRIGVDDTIFVINRNYITDGIPYSPEVIKLMRTDYYIHGRLDRYLAFSAKSGELIVGGGDSLSGAIIGDARKIVEAVNANRDYDYHTHVQPANLDNGYSILVNKYYELSADYEPNNLVAMDPIYGGAGRFLEQKTYMAYQTMYEEAAAAGLELWVNSAYRSFETQAELYDSYSVAYGKAEADLMSAWPGFSEHQTGLAVDIVNGSATFGSFETTAEFAWLKDNAHRFGFILRYQEGWEDLTGYMYEPWHYRYVGPEIATFIYEKQITLEEYYAYFVL